MTIEPTLFGQKMTATSPYLSHLHGPLAVRGRFADDSLLPPIWQCAGAAAGRREGAVTAGRGGSIRQQQRLDNLVQLRPERFLERATHALQVGLVFTAPLCAVLQQHSVDGFDS